MTSIEENTTDTEIAYVRAVFARYAATEAKAARGDAEAAAIVAGASPAVRAMFADIADASDEQLAVWDQYAEGVEAAGLVEHVEAAAASVTITEEGCWLIGEPAEGGEMTYADAYCDEINFAYGDFDYIRETWRDAAADGETGTEAATRILEKAWDAMRGNVPATFDGWELDVIRRTMPAHVDYHQAMQTVEGARKWDAEHVAEVGARWDTGRAAAEGARWATYAEVFDAAQRGDEDAAAIVAHIAAVDGGTVTAEVVAD
jgi:hypothetical protein